MMVRGSFMQRSLVRIPLCATMRRKLSQYFNIEVIGSNPDSLEVVAYTK